MTLIARLTVAALLWTVAFVVADAQSPEPAPPPDDVTLETAVVGPAPGTERTGVARVRNTDDRPVLIARDRAEVGDAAPACTAALVDRAVPRESVRVPGDATATVPVEVSLASGAPAACEGASWPLVLPATAEAPARTAAADDGPGLIVYLAAGAVLLLVTVAVVLVVGLLRRPRPQVPGAPAPTPGGRGRPRAADADDHRRRVRSGTG